MQYFIIPDYPQALSLVKIDKKKKKIINKRKESKKKEERVLSKLSEIKDD